MQIQVEIDTVLRIFYSWKVEQTTLNLTIISIVHRPDPKESFDAFQLRIGFFIFECLWSRACDKIELKVLALHTVNDDQGETLRYQKVDTNVFKMNAHHHAPHFYRFLLRQSFLLKKEKKKQKKEVKVFSVLACLLKAFESRDMKRTNKAIDPLSFRSPKQRFANFHESKVDGKKINCPRVGMIAWKAALSVSKRQHQLFLFSVFEKRYSKLGLRLLSLSLFE